MLESLSIPLYLPAAKTTKHSNDGNQQYKGKKIIIGFDAKKCIHSRNCVLENPQVFVPNAPGDWIQTDAASLEEIVSLAHQCPSEAITYERLDGGAQEKAPPSLFMLI